jgi:hypothetical protein
MTETRKVHDPFLGKDVEVSDRLVDRLRGKYASGPHLPNGNPEFGWRQFQAPPIQHEAAAEIERLQLQLEATQHALKLQALNIGIQRREAVKLLSPFGRLAEVCDHFKRLPDQEICSWRIVGKRTKGPTADDCRAARDFLNQVSGDWA